MTTDTPRQGRRRPAAKPTEAVVETPAEEIKGVTAAKGRATPSRRVLPETEERRGFLGRIVDYVAGVRGELDKVAWPTREQVGRLFRIVLTVTIVAAIILGAISLGFAELFRFGLQNPVIFAVFGLAVAAITVVVLRRNSE